MAQGGTSKSASKGIPRVWLALAVGVLVVALSLLNFYELIELKTLDQRFLIRNWLFGPPRQIRRLATIDVDDYSVDREGRFEDWDRTYHARVINIVGALGAKAVGVDFLLPEPSTPMIRESQVRSSDVSTREDVLALFQNPDYVLADVAKQWNNVYYAQYLTDSEVQDYDRSLATNLPRTPVQERRFKLVMPYTLPLTEEFEKHFIVGSQLWAPVDTLIATARGVGQVQPLPDVDGIVRRNRAFYIYDGRIFPTLSLLVACDYLGVPLDSVRMLPGQVILPNAHVPGEEVPRDVRIPVSKTRQGTILINWVGDYRSTYRHYPYSSIITFWENYQRDRLAQAAKRELLRDPSLLQRILGGEVDLGQFTIRLMLVQAGFPPVDVLTGLQDAAVAVRFSGHVIRGDSFEEAAETVFGSPARTVPDVNRWRAIYAGLQANRRVARALRANPALTPQEAAQTLDVPPDALAKAFAQLRPLMSPATGEIPARQYPLWFFERTLDGTPIASRHILNSHLAAVMKHHLRTHVALGDSIIASIGTQDPQLQGKLTEAAIRLIAVSANYPDQDYGAVVGAVVQAALLEPIVAEGVSFDQLAETLFGVPPSSLPSDLVEPYRQSYESLWRSLQLARMLNASPDMTLAAATDSLSALRIAKLTAERPDLPAGSARTSGMFRPTDIEGDYHVIASLVKEYGSVPEDAHPLVFYTVVVDGRPVFASDFKDAVIFYGITSTGGHDRNPTPFEPRYPMVGMHLNLFNQIITGSFLQRPEKWVNWLVILGIALLMGWLVPRMSPANGGFVMVGMLVAFVVVAVLLFARVGIWLDSVGPVGAIIFTYLAITVRNYIVEEKEKKFIKGAFAAYLAPEVVEQIANDPSSLALGGKEMEITAFFSDIKGFSTISEALTPTQLVELLNEYFTDMLDILLQHQGTVDKLIGDAIVAFFGAPIAYPDHATKACHAVVAAQRRLAELRPRFKEVWGQNVYNRIGLNSDRVVVGNMGSRTRFNYTMMGDGVNLAARLESGAKQYGIYSQISEFTYAQAKDNIEVRELDKIVVIGKSEPVTTYELLAEKGNISPDKRRMVGFYEEGLALYRQKRWEQAVGKFREAIAADGDHGDPTSEIMIARCESILKGEVKMPEDWDGVWALTSK